MPTVLITLAALVVAIAKKDLADLALQIISGIFLSSYSFLGWGCLASCFANHTWMLFFMMVCFVF